MRMGSVGCEAGKQSLVVSLQTAHGEDLLFALFCYQSRKVLKSIAYGADY